MTSGAKVRDDKIQISKTVLFQQLIVLMEHTIFLLSLSMSVFTPTSTSLFKDGYMREAVKSDSASASSPPSYLRHQQTQHT